VSSRPIALLGLRCSGKSTVGRLLARRLSRAFVDLDEEVLRFARHAGRADPDVESVGALLDHLGLGGFRDLEAGVLKKLIEPSPAIVLATGGGVVERTDNRTWLRRVARCVWISVPVEVLQERMRLDSCYRPPLLGGDPIAEVPAVLARRAPWFRELAEVVVEAGARSPDVLAGQILAELARDSQSTLKSGTE